MGNLFLKQNQTYFPYTPHPYLTRTTKFPVRNEQRSASSGLCILPVLTESTLQVCCETVAAVSPLPTAVDTLPLTGKGRYNDFKPQWFKAEGGSGDITKDEGLTAVDNGKGPCTPSDNLQNLLK